MYYEQSAYNDYTRPGYYAREYRKRTGKMRRIHAEELAKKMEKRTGPLAIEDMPTTLVQSVRLPQEQIEQMIDESKNLHSQKIEIPQPSMPIDVHGRPYLGIINPYEDTVRLAEQLVLKFHAMRGGYPGMIYLSAFRYLTRNSSHFCIGNTLIPYAYDPHSVTFDVMVRGEKIFSL